MTFLPPKISYITQIFPNTYIFFLSKVKDASEPGQRPPPASSPNWVRLRRLIQSFCHSTVHLLSQLTAPDMLHYFLKHLDAFVPYFIYTPKLAGKLLKVENSWKIL